MDLALVIAAVVVAAAAILVAVLLPARAKPSLEPSPGGRPRVHHVTPAATGGAYRIGGGPTGRLQL
jgi:hypothetical protein